MCKIRFFVSFRFCYTFLFLLATFRTNAQEKQIFGDVQYTSIRLSGAVEIAGEIKGYYILYVPGQSKKHTNNYVVQTFDEKLLPVKKFNFITPDNENLLETLFDGTRFICLFLNEKNKTITNSIYDQDGKLIVSYPKELDKNSMYYFNDDVSTIVSNGGQNRYLHAIDGKGYFTLIPLKHGSVFSYDINIYLNNEIKQLTYQSNADVKFEKATYLGATDSLLFFSILSKKVLVNNNYESTLLGIDIHDDTKKFIITTATDEYQYLPVSVSALKTDRMLVQGIYFKKNDKMQKTKSLGMCALQMNHDGVVTSVKFNEWKNDFSRYIVLVDTGGTYDLGHLYFHKFIPMADGNIYAIAEGYKKTDNTGRVLLNVISGLSVVTLLGSPGIFLAPNMKITSNITITDLALVKFDTAFTIQDATVYSKNAHGAITFDEFVSTHLEAAKAKLTGSFDYLFTQTNQDRTQFFTVYRTIEDSKTCKCVVFKGINYDNGKVVSRSLNLSTEANNVWLLPSKPGTVVVMEHFKKEKRLDIHIETM